MFAFRAALFSATIVCIGFNATALRAAPIDDCRSASGNTALSLCSRVIDNEREKPATRAYASLLRGRAEMDLANLEQAEADINAALTFSPQNVFGYRLRGRLRSLQARESEARADFDKAVQLPQTPDSKYVSHVERGNFLVRNMELSPALEDFTAAIRLDPTKASAYVGRAIANKAGGNIANALSDLDQAKALEPKLKSAYIERGDILITEKRFAEAIADFDAALAVDAKDARALKGRSAAAALSKVAGLSAPAPSGPPPVPNSPPPTRTPAPPKVAGPTATPSTSPPPTEIPDELTDPDPETFPQQAPPKPVAPPTPMPQFVPQRTTAAPPPAPTPTPAPSPTFQPAPKPQPAPSQATPAPSQPAPQPAPSQPAPPQQPAQSQPAPQPAPSQPTPPQQPAQAQPAPAPQPGQPAPESAQAPAPSPRDAKLKEAITLRQGGKGKEALAIYEELLRAKKDDLEVIIEKGRTLTGLGQHKDALDTLKPVIEGKNVPPAIKAAAFEAQSESLAITGQYDASILSAAAALSINPKLVNAHFWRGISSYLTGAFDTATADFGVAGTLVPNSAVYPAWEGLAFASNGDLAKAKDAIERSNKIQPDNNLALMMRARMQLIAGNIDGAEADIATLSRRGPLQGLALETQQLILVNKIFKPTDAPAAKQ